MTDRTDTFTLPALDFHDKTYNLVHANIKFQVLDMNAKIPQRGNDFAAGYDLYAIGEHTLYPNEGRMIPLGFATEIPPGYWVQIMSRSGLATRGFTVLAGVIDPDYRGEWKVILRNVGHEKLDIHPGDRVAQAVLRTRYGMQFEVVEQLTDTSRGSGGMGSTGQ